MTAPAAARPSAFEAARRQPGARSEATARSEITEQTDAARQSRTARRRSWLASMPKPKARGWIHGIMTPLALANSIVLIVLAPTWQLDLACVVFGLSAVALFGNSAVYHLGSWSQKVHAVLRRIDHSNIFLLIAGTYTPLSVALLDARQATLVLSIVWGGAALGIGMSVFWPSAPRWLYVPLYVALGWVAVWFLPAFWHSGGPAIVWLIIAGGLAYTVGALFYGLRWPNPWPRVWGFHEFFHLCTVAGYVTQAVAVWLAVMSAA